jgi:hypothetical protein
LVSSRIIAELDDALTEEIIKENGLERIPVEARRTLVEPEKVLKTWSAGTWGAVATDRRLFIRHGRLSRKVAEMPYSNISYIEHTRRYPWKILVAGLLPSLGILLEPLWRSVLKSTFISTVEEFLNSIMAMVPQLASHQTLLILFAIIPILLSLAVFGIQSRTGFNLYGSGMKPIYLPHNFSELIAFIRKVQDSQQTVVRTEGIVAENDATT